MCLKDKAIRLSWRLDQKITGTGEAHSPKDSESERKEGEYEYVGGVRSSQSSLVSDDLLSKYNDLLTGQVRYALWVSSCLVVYGREGGNRAGWIQRNRRNDHNTSNLQTAQISE